MIIQSRISRKCSNEENAVDFDLTTESTNGELQVTRDDEPEMNSVATTRGRGG